MGSLSFNIIGESESYQWEIYFLFFFLFEINFAFVKVLIWWDLTKKELICIWCPIHQIPLAFWSLLTWPENKENFKQLRRATFTRGVLKRNKTFGCSVNKKNSLILLKVDVKHFSWHLSVICFLSFNPFHSFLSLSLSLLSFFLSFLIKFFSLSF